MSLVKQVTMEFPGSVAFAAGSWLRPGSDGFTRLPPEDESLQRPHFRSPGPGARRAASGRVMRTAAVEKWPV